MKEQNILTLQETEHLCRLYMDCRLDVLEETELQYVLSQVDYRSPLIDDVRVLMGISILTAEKTSVVTIPRRNTDSRKWKTYLSVAASIAVIFIMGLTLFLNPSDGKPKNVSYYIAYVDGNRLSEEEAKSQIEAEIQSADEFIKEMAELEENQQQMINNFFNP